MTTLYHLNNVGYVIVVISGIMFFDAMTNLNKENRVLFSVAYFFGSFFLLSVGVAASLSTEWVV